MKIKICLELSGDNFKYEYEVGGERQAGEMPFGEDHLEWIACVIKGSKSMRAYKKMMEVHTRCPIINKD